jgi:hypothetical protein
MKLRIILAVAVAATAATPTAAFAAGTISGGPAKLAGGYTVMLQGTDAKPDRLTIIVTRGTEANGQNDILDVTSGVRVTVTGGSATIKGSLGTRGKVDLRLQGARKDSGRKLPKGCTGTPKATYTGRLAGRLELRLPNGRKATIRSLPASTQVGGGLIQCPDRGDRRRGDGDGGDGHSDDNEPRLILSGQSDGATFSFVATKRSLSLVRSVAPKKERGATVSTMTSVQASGSNLLQPAEGGATAALKSAGAFTGNGAYRSSVGPGAMTTGTLTGSLAVKLQGVPAIAIAGENAVLMNGDKSST